MRSISLSAAAMLSVLVATHGSAAEPTVHAATELCGVAVSPMGGAEVIASDGCDVRTAALVQKLLDRSQQQNEKLRSQVARFDGLARRARQISAAINTINALAAERHTPAALRAAELLMQGDAKEASALLGLEAEQSRHEPADASHNPAQLYRQQAALLRAQDAGQSLRALEQALAIEPEDVATLWDAGDLAALIGSNDVARQHYLSMREAAAMQLKAQPGNSALEWHLFLSHTKIADAQRAQGDAEAGLQSYQTGLLIAKRLAASAPGNTEWQHDLGVIYNKIGDLFGDEGDTAAALENYRTAMLIREKLAASASRNGEWQRELWISYNNLGDTQLIRQDAQAALLNYRSGLRVADALVARDSSNAQWKVDLAVSCLRVGLLIGLESDSDARSLLERGFELARSLQRAGQLPASSAGLPAMLEKALSDL